MVDSTRNGTAGFGVEFADGGSMNEAEAAWDDIPRDRPISALVIKHLRNGHEWVRLDARGKDHVFFVNEAIAMRETQREVHAAKIFGFIAGEQVTEVRIEFPPDVRPQVSVREYPVSAFGFERDKVLRPGAAG